MGLDISVPGGDKRVSWSYHGFMHFRRAIWRVAPLPVLETTWFGDDGNEVEEGPIVKRRELHDWDDLDKYVSESGYEWYAIWQINDPLLVLLAHPDNETEIAPCWLPALAQRLREVAPQLDTDETFGHHGQQAEALADACDKAIELDVPLRFS